MATFGERVKLLRDRVGLSQEDLTKRLGLKRLSTVQSYESGRVKWPREKNARRLAAALEIQPNELLDGVTRPLDELQATTMTPATSVSSRKPLENVARTADEKRLLQLWREARQKEQALNALFLLVASRRRRRAPAPREAHTEAPEAVETKARGKRRSG